jgi:asparagine synthase (glutamine-hydrolysing)
MLGIVGLITKKPRTQAEPELLSMLEVMKHESFYETGTFIDESLGVYAGWTVLKHSFADGMPVRNECGNVALIFSGEEFPEPDVVEHLKSRGHDVTRGDASYLVHVYEEDPTFPASLNGRFQGLVADCRTRTVALFNDRYGMNKLYYHEENDAFYFSAEAKAILRVLPDLRSLDTKGMAETAAFRCVRDNRTMFKGIDAMPPASRWVFRNGSVSQKDAYFQPREWEDQEPLSPESYYQELRDTFVRTLPNYLSARERIGIALTGGLDTRMIMAWLRGPSGSLPCYTFGGMHRDCQDVILARRIAGLCGQTHQVIPLGREFLAAFPRYAERSVLLTDGCATVEASPLLYVQEKARQIAQVRVSGVYGSEILRGPAVFKPVKLTPGVFHPDFWAQIEAAKERFAAQQRHPVSSVIFQDTQVRGFEGVERTQVAIRTPFLDNRLVRVVFRAPKHGLVKGDIFANNEFCNRLIADGSSPLRNLRTDRGLSGKDSLAATLTKEWLEFTFYAEWAYDYGMPQWFAPIDRMLSPLHLERLFLGRHKYYHFRTFYRGPLSGYVQDMLLDRRTLSRPFFQKKGIERIVHQHLKGTRNYTAEIHQLLTLELIQRLLIDEP